MSFHRAVRPILVAFAVFGIPVCLLADTYVPVLIKDYPTGGSVSGYVNESFPFTVEATDSGGNLSAAEWYLGTTLKRTNSISGYYWAVPTFSWSWGTSGTYNVSVTIKDSSGNAAYGGWSVTVVNRKPTATRSSPSSSSVSVNAGSTQQFTVAAADQDGNLSYVEWYRDGNYVGRTNISGSSTTTSHNETFNNADSYTVTAIVYDAENANSAATWNVTATCASVGSFSLVAPASGAVLASGTTSTTLQWNAASGASAYDVYFGTGSSPGIYASDVASLTRDVPVTPGQTYSWRIKAKNSCGSQTFSPSSGYRSFSVAAPSGGLSVTVRNLDASLKSGATCKLYDGSYQYLSQQDRTSVSGVCSWSSLAIGSYHVEAWNPSLLHPFPGDEFWGALPVTVTNNATTSATVQRVEPYVAVRPEFRLNDANGRILAPTDHVYSGQTIFVKATVLQQAGFSQSSTVRMAFDLARDSTYDVAPPESAPQTVASGGSGTPFTFSFIVPDPGSSPSVTLGYGLRVQTLTSTWSKTDGWTWGDAFVIDNASTVTVEPPAVRAGNTCPLLIRVRNLALPIDGSTTVRALKNGVVDSSLAFTVDTSKTTALYARLMCSSGADRSVDMRDLQITSGGATVTIPNALKILAPRSAPPYLGPYVWESICTRIFTFLSDPAAARAEVQALKAQGFRTVFLQTDCGILGSAYEAGLNAFLDEAQSVSPPLDVHAYAANGNENFRSTAKDEAQEVMNWNAAHARDFQGIHLNFEPPQNDEDAMFEALDTTAEIAIAHGQQTLVSLTSGSKGSFGGSALDWRLDTSHSPAVDYCDATQFAAIFIPQAYLIDAGFDHSAGSLGAPADLQTLIDDRLTYVTPISGDKTVDDSALSFLGISNYDRVTAVKTANGADYQNIGQVNYYLSSEARYCGELDRTLTRLRAGLPNSEAVTLYPQGIETHIFTVGANATFPFITDNASFVLTQGQKLVVSKTTSTSSVVQRIPNGRYAVWHAARLTGETPSAPYGLATAVSANGTDLSWQFTCTCMTGFIVEKKIGSGSWLPIADVPVDLSNPSPMIRTATYRDAQSTACSGVSYRVKSYDAVKQSAYSAVASVSCASKPSASTNSASVITESTATLNAVVNPNNAQTTTSFDYGATSSYGNSVQAQTLTGNSDQPASASISGLQCGLQYHFRVIAANGAGTTTGDDATFSTSACISNGLQAHWPLDGNGADVSGHNNALTLAGTIPTADRFGQSNHAVALDAASQSALSLADGPATDLTTAFTWAGWVSFGRIGTAADGFASKTDGNGNASSMFYADTFAWDGSAPRYNQIRFWVLNGTSAYGFERAGPVLVKDTWYHVALVYDGAAGSAGVYVNGALTNTTSAPHSLNNVVPPFMMGRGTMTGALDDVYWYSRALSAAEIAQLVAPAAPASVTATATSATSVNVTWTAVPGASSYTVYRKAAGGSFTNVGSTAGNSLTDTASSGAAYLYKVTASGAGGTSPDSNVDLATTVVFTDATLTARSTAIKSVHVTQLRTAVNAVRALASLASHPFTDLALSAGMPVRSLHLTELRSALAAARSALGLSSLAYGESTITARATSVKASHLTELRDGVR